MSWCLWRWGHTPHQTSLRSVGAGQARSAIQLQTLVLSIIEYLILVPLATRTHLFPSRTQQLSPSAPMVVVPVTARVGRCQDQVLRYEEVARACPASERSEWCGVGRCQDIGLFYSWEDNLAAFLPRTHFFLQWSASSAGDPRFGTGCFCASEALFMMHANYPF